MRVAPSRSRVRFEDSMRQPQVQAARAVCFFSRLSPEADGPSRRYGEYHSPHNSGFFGTVEDFYHWSVA